MSWSQRLLLTGALLIAGAAFGCVYHHHHEEPVAVLTYEPGYYDRGYYRDNDWYWHDRSGHEFHEAREDHERRMRDWGDRRDHDEHHDRDEHR